MKKGWLILITVIVSIVLLACSTEPSGSDSVAENQENNSEKQTNDATEEQVNTYVPERTIRYIVGFAAGGGTDLAARTLAQVMQEEGIIDVSFAIENITGAGGGMSLMEQHTRGDDHTLLQMVDIGSPIWKGEISATFEDFKPVAQIANNTLLLVVNSESAYQTVDDLFQAMKDNPSQVTIGLPGTTDQFEVVKWNEIAAEYGIDANLNFIPTGGISEVIPEVLGKRIDAALVVPPVASGYLETNELKALAALSDNRLEFLPEIPTLVEQGINVTFYRPQGVFLKGDVKEDVIAFWEDAIKRATESESWQKFLDERMFINEYKNSQEYTEWMRKEGEAYKVYLEALN